MIVTDASVVFKWLKSKDEPYHEEALVILQSHLSNRNKIIIPHILFVEIANSLVTKTDTTVKTITDNLKYLFGVNLEVKLPDANDIIESSKLSKKYKTAVYDMLYAVMAKKHKTVLITADEKFVRKTQFPFVKLLSEYKPK